MVSMDVKENSQSPQTLPMPKPHDVGREFVRQYFTLLSEAPRFVHRFYSNESIYVHGNDGEEIIGQDAIRKRIDELYQEVNDCSTKIRALDAHETFNKGIVLQVIGEISIGGGPMRRFVQTFVLVPQSEKKYYIHNDIFRYEDEIFNDSSAQESEAPVDPNYAQAVSGPAFSVHSEQRPQPPMSNGSAHPEQLPMDRIPLQAQNQQPPSVALSSAQPTPQQSSSTAHGAAQYAPPLPQRSNVQSAQEKQPTEQDEAGTAYNLNVMRSSGNISDGAAPTVSGQPAQPQRPMQQQPAPPQSTPTLPSQSLPAATGSSVTPTVNEVARPPSVDKSSPAVSEEQEAQADASSTTGGSSWASIAKSKARPATTQQPPPQQQHITQDPGTSTVAAVSPGTTAGRPPSSDYGGGMKQAGQNRISQPQPQQQPYRSGSQSNAYGGNVGSQDARASPAPSGHQHYGGGGNAPYRSGNLDNLPMDQQIFINSLPADITETELRKFINDQFNVDVMDMRIIRKKNPDNTYNTQKPMHCFAFVAFHTAEEVNKVMNMVNTRSQILCRDMEVIIQPKRHQVDKMGGGHYGPRNINVPGSMGGGMGRGGFNRQSVNGPGGNPNIRGAGNMNRGGAHGGNIGGGNFMGGQGGGGGGNRSGSRTFHQTGGGRGTPYPAAPSHG